MKCRLHVRRALALVAVAASVMCPGVVVAADPWPSDAPAVVPKIRQLMQDRNYAEAIKAIDDAAVMKDSPRDYLAYLKGRALFLQNEPDRAVAVFDAMQKDFPESVWLRRARFAKAAALARKGDFHAAELIVRAEAEHLLSADRRQQIADIYLEFANPLFKPPKEDQAPDYARALEFYQKALEAGPKLERRIEIELLVAQCQQNLQKYDAAATLYEKFIEEHPRDALDVEARFRLGECRRAEDNLKQARRAWQDLLAKHADSASERIAEAQYELASTWHVPSPQNDDELSLGVAALRAFIERFPKHKLASRAHLEIAESLMARNRHDDAVAALRQFLADPRYQDREEIADARNLLGRCYQRQRKIPEAIEAWREYLAKHPAHKAWSDVQREIVDSEDLLAEMKLQAKEYDAANKLFAEFLAKYPLDSRNPQILMLMNRKACEEKNWDEAIANWRRIVSKYPDTGEASTAQFLIAQTLETKLGKLEEALEAYRKAGRGPSANNALQAIARLTSPSMTVATERVFRSHATPRLKLVTRNIESVTVRAYKVDMETYFRKMHLAKGIEGLDIALIDPDKTFEFKVPKYAKYQQSDSAIEVPLAAGARAGVMAVTVSSKTMEATTLVIQSDLDAIVKSSHDEVFIFTENMRTGKPWQNVRLLISSGQQIFAEGTTDKSGVFQRSFKELKDLEDVRVLAVAEGNVATNAVDLRGVGIAQGLADKGYLYTDRPAYRAGQTVCVRGCLRRAVDDAYTIEKGRKLTLEVFDNRGRLLWQEAVKLGEFGSVHSQFALPESCPEGQCRVVVRDDAGKSYQGTFLVREYRLEPVRLAVDAPRSVYYRGEEIEGTIRATFYYGAPLVGREIRYRLADDRQYTAKTDERGEVRFKLPTREYSETQLLALKVELPERNVQTSVNYALAAQGFGVKVATVRPVFVAGETFEASVVARDAEGKPIAQKLTAKILEQTTVDGKVGERLVEEHPLETAVADGTTRKTFKLEKGGNYIIRVEGIDRFKNSVAGQCQVMVSDAADKVRLRILADRHSYKVGDTGAIAVHWREQPALALVTFQGARVLDYRLVELTTGVNPLSIPITAKLAPNFELSVAVMSDKVDGEKAKQEGAGRSFVRFHESSSPFTVERDLRVKIVAKQPVQPGAPVQIDVTTTDPQGKPVAAELSLAMVEQSLLDQFGWSVPAIDRFFQGEPRVSAVRTASSITFAYAPRTQAINDRLLAEQDRLQLSAEEEASRAQLEMQRQAELDARRSLTGAEGASAVKDREADESSSYVLGVPMYSSPGSFAKSLRPLRSHRGASDDPFAEEGPEGALAEDQADFNSLIELITSTVKPVEWGDKPVAAARSKAKGKVLSGGIATGFRATFASAPRVKDNPTTIAESAYWNPAIVTDKDGKATVTFTVPERSTAWRLLAKGITTDTLAGEAAESLVVKKELFGELKLPQSFTDGDRSEIIAAVCNDAVDKGPIEVTLKTTFDGCSLEQKKTIGATSRGLQEVAFNVELVNAEKAGGQANRIEFELTVAAGGRRDVSRRSVPVLPYGAAVFATAAGSATTDTTAWIEPPQNMTLERPRLTILIGPTVEQSLLDALFAPALGCQAETDRMASGIESATSDLMAAVGLQQLLGASRDAGSPVAERLDARIRAGIGLLVSAQNDAGGWSWTGRSADGDRHATARALWALGLARKAGYVVPDDCFNKSIALVEKQMAAASESDYEGKTILLAALTTVDKGDFALANRLYRERLHLSTGALVHLALAMAEMDRGPTAVELLELLAKRSVDGIAADAADQQRTLPWSQSPVELRTLWLLALERAAPQSPKAKELADWLLAHRVGHRWSPDKATGPAMLALCQWFGKTRFQGERYALAISVNDAQAKRIEIDPTAGTQTIEVPAEMRAKQGKQRIGFQIAGRGRYTYQCILGGFVPADKLKSTTDDWRVERIYEPAPLEVDGREIARGFGVLRGVWTPFKNPLTQLPVGRRGRVTLRIARDRAAPDAPVEQLPYLVVSEPIPSGATVIEKSVDGGFERFEIGPGVITFYVGNRRHVGEIHYDLYGYLSGSYRAGPTLVRNAHRPEQQAVAAAQTLTVLPPGATSSDPYRLTPMELFELGKLCSAKGDLKTAVAHLTELIGKWNVEPETYKQAVTILLDAHLTLGPPAQVVRYFEIVKEKWPDQEIAFDKIVKVGAAYDALGEFERSYLVFRATVESNFLRESGVAGFLEARGQFLRSVEVLGRLLRDYPPEGYIASASYALAQHIYAKAPDAVNNAELRKQKVNKVDLVRRAWTMLESFLTAHPDDPAADQAAFAAATALLDLKSYKEAAAACDQYARRYPKSELLDAYWYVMGYCRFAGGEHRAAIDMCRKVAAATHVDPATGQETESRNKWRAIYILGQVHHSLGEAAEAIREYRRVEDKFTDAKQAIDYFLHKAIELPEVVTVKPGEAAEVELKFRNVAACDLKVYRIDLMKFSLLKRNLGGISQINLAGIRPHHEASVALGDGRDYRDRTHKLPLPLKDEGAYLVVCRGDDLHSSGLVLVTPMAVEVQVDNGSGRVRAMVKDRTSDKCLNDVHIKVIGSQNTDFISGQTDLRGVFVADGIRGAATVIAQAGPSRYAMYRAAETVVPEHPEANDAPARRRPRTQAAVSPATESVAQTAESLGGVDAEANQKIKDALKSPTQIEFVETPLSDVIDYLRDYHEIQIQFEEKALSEVGIGTDTPVTINVKGISLRSALRTMLRRLSLAFTVQDGMLCITTPEDAECQMETKIYPIGDLVLPPNASGQSPDDQQADFDSLIDLLSTTVKPQAWDSVGGAGSISPYENGSALAIVVNQTQEVHEEIEDVLAKLRKIKPEGSGKAIPSKPRASVKGASAPGPNGAGNMRGGRMHANGMGGMGGGMGGGSIGALDGNMFSQGRGPAQAAPQQSDLLQGVQETNKSFQGMQSEKLQKMYNNSGGKKGVGAGSAF